jgi:hypothetical protein
VSIRLGKPSQPILIAEPGRLDDEHGYRTMVMPARLPD